MTWLLNWNVIHFVNKRIAKLLAVTTAIKENKEKNLVKKAPSWFISKVKKQMSNLSY